MTVPVNSLVVPVYDNAESIVSLVEAVRHVDDLTIGELEVVFVLDGSPDNSNELLLSTLSATPMRARLVEHSRNFGAFAAIRTGMSIARGRYIAVMAADLQEPNALIVEFFNRLASAEVDVVVGRRANRKDRGDNFSRLYWSLY